MKRRSRSLSRRSLLFCAAALGARTLAAPPLVRAAARGARSWLSAGSATPAVGAPYNGAGLTPAWGLNTYYGFGVDGFDEDILIEAALAIRDSGLWSAGYRLFAIDDGWSALDRDADGNLVADPRKFPSGMAALVDRLHALGFTAGIYGDMGYQTCQGRPGSYQHEAEDAAWFAAQGFDDIKMDWCTAEAFNAQERYTRMSEAILATGRRMTFNVCNWGRQNPWEWAPPIANAARTASDLSGIYDGDLRGRPYGSYQWSCLLKNLDANQHPEVAGPGFANDPDCLQVGNDFFQNQTEATAQLHLWAVMAAPMLLGLDPRSMSAETARLLTHPMLRAVNQDPLALQGVRVQAEHGMEVWVKPLADGQSHALVLFNRTDLPSTAAVAWKDIWDSNSAYVRDLWTGAAIGVQRTGYRTTLEPHASMLLQVVPQR